MAEYLAPGVYVEEVSFTSPTIEGVGTTTTGFAGPTLTGPVAGMPYGGWSPKLKLTDIAGGAILSSSPSAGLPQLLTSFGDFQNIYGGYANLSLPASATLPNQVNYMAMAVKAFFDNGGSQLYVSRVFANQPLADNVSVDPGVVSSGTATSANVVVTGRFPGAMLAGDTISVSLIATRSQSVANLPSGSLLGTPAVAADGHGGLATAVAFYRNGTGSTFSLGGDPTKPLSSTLPANLYAITLQVTAPGPTGQPMVFSNLGLDTNHPRFLGTLLGVNPPRAIDALQNQVWFNIGSGLNTADELLDELFTTWTDPAAIKTPQTVTFTLAGGSDGAEPVAADYTTALQYLEPLEDIAIVGTPGASAYADSKDILMGSLIPHVERQRSYRVAILEAGPALLDSGYEDLRAQVDSSYAAFYVPWILTPNPLAIAGTATPSQILVPPTGFMAGIYARNDTEKSVAKAPANEVILGAVDLERHISFREQMTLNPVGINCLRFFPDRGYRVWGARTVSSDTELMYINVRRYLIYLEHSIDNGTQWAVFENNGPALWARVEDALDSFLTAEFAEGNLLGTKPSDAFFVRCDRTTMTQNDLDNGRLICLIGVALLKPAEFVVFRIGQMTANARP